MTLDKKERERRERDVDDLSKLSAAFRCREYLCEAHARIEELETGLKDLTDRFIAMRAERDGWRRRAEDSDAD